MEKVRSLAIPIATHILKRIVPAVVFLIIVGGSSPAESGAFVLIGVTALASYAGLQFGHVMNEDPSVRA